MNDELKRMIHEHMIEEQTDSDTYMRMAEMAEGHCHGVLCDIAHDEETHHKLLKEMLNDV